MYGLFMLCLAIFVGEVLSNEIKSKIDAYYESEIIKSFTLQWKNHESAFEHSLSLALQEGYGHKAMNVYINRIHNPLDVTCGYYHTDNQVHLLIENMMLEELPHLSETNFYFPLSLNTLSVGASVSKMIVHGSYVLLRNKSDIIFSVAEQDPYESSPFRFQQVRNSGEVAITIEGCILSGIIIATLSGTSVHLGYNKFNLTDCRYNLEIYTPGAGSPPVMVPYLPKRDEHLNIEHLLMRPITEELLPKLQATMFSFVNTSNLITKELWEIQKAQKKIFEETHAYVDNVVDNINKRTVESINMCTTYLEDFAIGWDEPCEITPNVSAVKLDNMMLMGLNTLYSSHTGGPLKLTETEIVEQLRFSSLQVLGKLSVIGFRNDNDFAIEIIDFAVDVTIDSNLNAKFEPVGWRSLEFSCPTMETPSVKTFIVGYLLHEIPKRLTIHLNSAFNGGNPHHCETNHEGILKEDIEDPDITNNSSEISAINEDKQLNHPVYTDSSEDDEIIGLDRYKHYPKITEKSAPYVTAGMYKKRKRTNNASYNKPKNKKASHSNMNLQTQHHSKIWLSGRSGKGEKSNKVKRILKTKNEYEGPITLHLVDAVPLNKNLKTVSKKVPSNTSMKKALRKIKNPTEKIHDPKSQIQQKLVKSARRRLDQTSIPTRSQKPNYISE